MIEILPVDEYVFRIKSDPSTLYDIEEAFSFFADGYKFMPSFKAGYWDGKIRIFLATKPFMPKGLLVELHKYCKDRQLKMCFPEGRLTPDSSNFSDENFVALKAYAKKITTDEYEDREYQLDSFCELVARERAVVMSSTSSGKTLMMYRIARHFSELVGKPALVVTSRTNLVVQGKLDYESFLPDGQRFNVSTLKGDSKITTMKGVDCVISTWQSATKKDSDWLNQFSIIIADEAHGWNNKSCSSLMEKCTHVKYRYAFTGTLNESKVNMLLLTGMFGPVITVSKTKDRIDAGDTAGLDIKCVKLSYGPEDRKHLSKYHFDPDTRRWKRATYQEEIDFIISHQARRDVLVKMMKSLVGNTLMVFHRNDEFGKPMKEIFDAAGMDVHLVYGGTDDEDRETIRQLLNSGKDVKVMASIGVFSEGMSANDIRNVVLAYPVKGRVKLLQIIGRGLRKADGKKVCKFFDLSDDLSTKKDENYAWRHALRRCEIYDEEGFEYKWHTLEIKEKHNMINDLTD